MISHKELRQRKEQLELKISKLLEEFYFDTSFCVKVKASINEVQVPTFDETNLNTKELEPVAERPDVRVKVFI